MFKKLCQNLLLLTQVDNFQHEMFRFCRQKASTITNAAKTFARLSEMLPLTACFVVTSWSTCRTCRKSLPKFQGCPNRVVSFSAISPNRTFVSKRVAIEIWQDWKRWAIMSPNLHVWKMFIKPDEIKELLASNGLA